MSQPVGPHPVVVLTVNRLAEPLAAVTVAVVTGTPGPRSTHVPVGAASGLITYEESYVHCADLHTVAKSGLRRRLGLLSPTELTRVEENIGLILGIRR